MNLPVGLIAAEHAATIFTAETKMIYQGKVVDYKDKEDELSSRYGNKMLPRPYINQLYFEVETMEDGINVIYGRGRWRSLVSIIKIDDARKWATVQYITGKQRTVLLDSCKMEHPHLVPVHFSCYKSIQEEIKLYYGKTMPGFKPNYLVSDNYEARVYTGMIYAFRKDSPIIESGKGLELVQDQKTLEFSVKDHNKPVYKPSKEMKDPGIINTHWADKLAICMLEAKRDIIEKQIENIETNMFESENKE